MEMESWLVSVVGFTGEKVRERNVILKLLFIKEGWVPFAINLQWKQRWRWLGWRTTLKQARQRRRIIVAGRPLPPSLDLDFFYSLS